MDQDISTSELLPLERKLNSLSNIRKLNHPSHATEVEYCGRTPIISLKLLHKNTALPWLLSSSHAHWGESRNCSLLWPTAILNPGYQGLELTMVILYLIQKRKTIDES
ncbi:CBK_G0011340.mRNA.1.CDS.1 [Saccharomyces cerevisiae]|nr:CBK_G0011340.mRNA.1.CDS.1 [Saccharomyces cerevisiae]CAI7214359.1 CBK_G0011340.mRNA.1.CDS.1 [Saccharomyces cerevisiae]